MKQHKVVTQYIEDPNKSLQSVLAGPEFLFGLITDLVESNDLYEIDHCAYDTYDTGYLVVLLVEHLMKGDYFHAIRECEKVIANVPVVFKDCASTGPDIAAIEEWSQIFHSKT